MLRTRFVFLCVSAPPRAPIFGSGLFGLRDWEITKLPFMMPSCCKNGGAAYASRLFLMQARFSGVLGSPLRHQAGKVGNFYLAAAAEGIQWLEYVTFERG